MRDGIFSVLYYKSEMETWFPHPIPPKLQGIILQLAGGTLVSTPTGDKREGIILQLDGKTVSTPFSLVNLSVLYYNRVLVEACFEGIILQFPVAS